MDLYSACLAFQVIFFREITMSVKMRSLYSDLYVSAVRTSPRTKSKETTIVQTLTVDC